MIKVGVAGYGVIGQRLADGVPGPELWLLQGPGEIGRVERCANGVSTVAVNDAQAARRQGARRIDDVRDERLAGQGVQDLGQVGIHALPLTGGEDDDIHAWDFLLDGPARQADDDAILAVLASRPQPALQGDRIGDHRKTNPGLAPMLFGG